MIMTAEKRPVEHLGRYALFDRIASGGMSDVYLARPIAAAGVARTVAVKRVHASLPRDRDAVAALVDEARIATRIRHPNVAQTLDVLTDGDGVALVLDYVHGETLSSVLRLLHRQRRAAPPRVVGRIICDALEGLHAAHEARSVDGEHLGVVHRDVSPQNLMVATDGSTRVLDFGVARAKGRLLVTAHGQCRGKPGYMAPEQARGDRLDRRADVFAVGVVLWEALTGRRLFPEGDAAMAGLVAIVPPSRWAPGLSPAADAVVGRAVAFEAGERFETARDMGTALAGAIDVASRWDVAEWLLAVAGPELERRFRLVQAVERARLAEEGAQAAQRPVRHSGARAMLVAGGLGLAAAGVYCDDPAPAPARAQVEPLAAHLGAPR
jgi:serine/threonine-protein kinase